MKPLVSIGMPVYNGERYLRGALDSLLSQDYHDLQLIISDNASTDATGEICREYAAFDDRVSYSRNQTNVGAAANFNLVSELAKGPYFMLAAHDDLWKPSYISRCLKQLDEHPGVVLCSSAVGYIGKTGYLLGSYFKTIDTLGLSVPERIHEIISSSETGFATYGLMNLKALRATNAFRGVFGSDLLRLLELSLLGEFAKVPERLFFYRVPDKPKTPMDYMRAINPKYAASAPVLLFTSMVSELFAAVLASDLDTVTKNMVRADFVRVLTYQNASWREHILEENAQPKNMRLREVRNFIDSLLPARVE